MLEPMWSLTRPTSGKLDEILARVAPLPLTYPTVGLSRAAPGSQPGYDREHHQLELDCDFAAAREALATFGTHRLPYLFIHPAGARVAEGANVLVVARIGPLWTINPCRIVLIEDSADRYSYAYGTLPGHSESGEESFTVERLGGQRVRVETVAFARPDDVLARLGKPVAHRVQRRIKVDYMRALQETARQTASRVA
jgi:uncharacterized protein (UPF0548 family)